MLIIIKLGSDPKNKSNIEKFQITKNAEISENKMSLKINKKIIKFKNSLYEINECCTLIIFKRKKYTNCNYKITI